MSGNGSGRESMRPCLTPSPPTLGSCWCAQERRLQRGMDYVSAYVVAGFLWVRFQKARFLDWVAPCSRFLALRFQNLGPQCRRDNLGFTVWNLAEACDTASGCIGPGKFRPWAEADNIRVGSRRRALLTLQAEAAGAPVVAGTAWGTLTETGLGASFGANQRRRCVSSFSGCYRRFSLPPT